MNLSKTNRDGMIEKNMGLVHSCAHKFSGKGVEYDDLFQAGCIGLIKAVDNFKEELGFSFSTYAVPVILGEIKRIFRDSGSVKVGRALKERSRAALKRREEITLSLGREPTVGELAKSLGIEAAEAAMLINASMPVMSLTVGEDAGEQLDVPVASPEDEISDLIALRQAVDSLDERDKHMIEMRYYDGMTQSAVAAVLGMTQVQVSRREKAVLQLLRKKLN